MQRLDLNRNAKCTHATILPNNRKRALWNGNTETWKGKCMNVVAREDWSD